MSIQGERADVTAELRAEGDDAELDDGAHGQLGDGVSRREPGERDFDAIARRGQVAEDEPAFQIGRRRAGGPLRVVAVGEPHDHVVEALDGEGEATSNPRTPY